MQYSNLILATLASLASAQNPFSINPLPQSISVGTPFNITWSPSTGTTDTVSLVLRQGDPSHLNTVATIASSIQNTGSYVWTPTSAIVNGGQYAFEIIDDGNKDIVNYSGQFAISSPNTVSSSATSSVTSLSSSAASILTASSNGTSTHTGSSTTTTGSSSSSETGSSKTSSASKTSTGTASSTSSTTAPSGNAATGLKVGGGLLALVGAVMAAL